MKSEKTWEQINSDQTDEKWSNHDRRVSDRRLGPSHAQQTQLLTRLTASLLKTWDVSDALKVIAECTVSALNYQDCVVYLRTGDMLVQRAAFGPKMANGQVQDVLEIPIGSGIVGAAAEQKQAVIVADTLNDPRYIVDEEIRRSELAVPIMVGDFVIGVIDSEHSEPNFFTSADSELVGAITSLLAARLGAAIAVERGLDPLVSDSTEAYRAIELMSGTDSLTGILNRQGFERSLGQAFDEKESFAIAVFDLDKFKDVNDRFGHGAGDEVLITFAHILSEDSPKGPHTSIARLGGDEFALINTDSDQDKFIANVELILKSVSEHHWRWGATSLEVSASAGICFGNNSSVWSKADQALLVAKRSGRNKAINYQTAYPQIASMELEEAELQTIKSAIESLALDTVVRRLSLVSDPDNDTKNIEMIAKFQPKNYAEKSVEKLLEVAERFGLSIELDLWLLGRATERLSTEEEDVSISIKVSRETFFSGDIIGMAEASLKKYGLNPNRLILEISEKLFVENLELSLTKIREMKSHQLNFGIYGVTNAWQIVPHINELDVAYAKVHVDCVELSKHNEIAQIGVTAIVEALKMAGIKSVATEIDTNEQFANVKSVGFDIVQGLYLSSS